MGSEVKFKDIKSIVGMEFLTILLTSKSCNVVKKENWQIYDPYEPTEFDNFDVLSISGKDDCSLYIYLKS